MPVLIKGVRHARTNERLPALREDNVKARRQNLLAGYLR